MVYSVKQIADIVRPIAEQHHLKAVYLFGSYARGTATEQSDIDLLIDTTGTSIKSLLGLAAVYCDLEAALKKQVDLITISSLEQSSSMVSQEHFRANVMAERVNLYAVA